MKELKKLLLFVGMAVAAVLPAEAQTQYVFMNGNRYYYVDNNAWSSTTTFSPNVIWSINSDVPYNNGRYLIITRGGNMWNRTYTPSLNANTNTAYTFDISDGEYVDYGGRYLATTLEQMSTGTDAGSRITAYQVTTANVPQTVVDGTVTTPTITPSAAQTIEYDGSLSFTASATGTQTVAPAHITYTFNGATYYYYINQIYTDAADFAQNSSVTPTYTWSLSGDGASALELMSTSGENTIVKYTGSASGTTATLTVTAKAGTATRTASVTINVTPVEPTAISATDATVYVGGSGAVAYTLTPDYAYNRVNVASSNTGVFTVTSPATGGGVDITPVAPGEATLTLTALNSDGSDGPSTSVTVTVRDICAAPQFSFAQSGSSVVATITTATPGATIRYTTDGTDPTPTTGNVYTGPFTSANGQTIKAIVVKGDYYDASEVATKTVNPIDYVKQGVSGGIVTLNDLEDHTWTYYQSAAKLPDGYPAAYLSSPDPRNVKLTYMRGKVSGASEVAISAIESDTMMVYYMTREKSVLGMSGDYPYTVISNPFSKRPRTTGSTGTNGYYGFAGWKVVSGGKYIAEYGDGQTLPLDATIHFTNFDTYDTNAISADIVLQATWTPATVTRSASAPTFSGGTYETNFWVLSGNPTGAVTVPANSTMTARYPDGTSSWDGNFTRAITAGGNNAKVEWVNMNSTQNINAAGFTFTMGRGIVNSGNGGYVYGCQTNKQCIHTVKIESGRYRRLYHLKADFSAGNEIDQLMILGCDYDRAKNDNDKLEFVNGMWVGYNNSLNRGNNDLYARGIVKSGDFNTHVTITNGYTGRFEEAYGELYYFSVAGTQNAGWRYLVVEGGHFRSIGGGIDLDDYGRQQATGRGFDLRVKGNAQIDGFVHGAANRSPSRGTRTMVFTGGDIKGWIAGGANGTTEADGELEGATYVYVGGKCRVDSETSTNVLNRAVGGNVFAAGCGYSITSSSGQVTLGTNLVLADNAYVERGVYGGGSYGYCPTNQTANIFITGGAVGGKSGGVNGTTYNADITGGVFGGACQNRGGTVNIYMNGGLVEGGLYGGSNANGNIQNNVTMHIDGGQVGTTTQSANIHGGGYGQATRVLGSVNLTLGEEDCSTVMDGVTVYGDVYGGSAEGRTNGNNGLTTGAETNVILYHGTIYGGLYGGGLGTASNPAYVYGPVAVKVYGGSVRTNDGSGENGSGCVFGCNNVNGTPQSTVTVDIYGTDPAPDANSFALFAVYGGGNRSHYTAGVPIVTIHGCNNSIEYVYGGGNASNVLGTNVTIWGGHIGNAFGGGNGYSVTGNHDDSLALHYNPGANITASGAHLTIHGGTIDAAFGGSNQWGTINGGINVTVEELTESANDPCTGAAYAPCSNLIVELYGGGNEAPGNGGTIDLTCGSSVMNFYGGARNAIIDGDIVLNVRGGEYDTIFGGNKDGGRITGNVTVNFTGGQTKCLFGGSNKGGNIEGTINVNVNIQPDPSCPDVRLDYVYGGGKDAFYRPTDTTNASPVVRIIHDTITKDVFGGGLGETAIVSANPLVVIGTDTCTKATPYAVRIRNNVYGGGNAAPVHGNPFVQTLSEGNKCVTTVDGNVYGGGYGPTAVVNTTKPAAAPGYGTGKTTVDIRGNRTTIEGNVYGGGNAGIVNGDTDVIIGDY